MAGESFDCPLSVKNVAKLLVVTYDNRKDKSILKDDILEAKGVDRDCVF